MQRVKACICFFIHLYEGIAAQNKAITFMDRA